MQEQFYQKHICSLTKMSDLSGVVNKEQLLGLADMELEFVEDNQEIIVVSARD